MRHKFHAETHITLMRFVNVVTSRFTMADVAGVHKNRQTQLPFDISIIYLSSIQMGANSTPSSPRWTNETSVFFSSFFYGQVLQARKRCDRNIVRRVCARHFMIISLFFACSYSLCILLAPANINCCNKCQQSHDPQTRNVLDTTNTCQLMAIEYIFFFCWFSHFIASFNGSYESQ